LRDDSTRTDRFHLLEGERLLEQLPRPGRKAPLVVAAYPSTYRTAMSNLGFHFLFRNLRLLTGARIERAYTDTAPYTLESGTPLSSAEAILFSVSYEEDFINLARMLALSGVELERTERGGSPVVVAGGAAVSANPVPLSDLADALCLGEGEETIERIAPLVVNGAGRRGVRLESELRRIEGIYVPGMGGSFPAAAGIGEFPRSIILTPDTVFPDTLLIESGRGCPGNCSFCLATTIYRPYRALSIEDVDAYLDGLSLPVRKIGLVSTAVAAHPRFGELVESLVDRGIEVSFGSLRAEDLDREKAHLVARAGTRSVSLAPESGSEEIRFRLGKRVTDDTYIGAVSSLREAGIGKIGLYMLVGCPGEGEGTIGRTRLFISRLKEAAGGARLSLHLNPLIPKPWTPLQFYGMPVKRELEARISSLRDLGRELGIAVQAKSLRSALRQATISLGNERVGRAIMRYAEGRISWGKALRNEGVVEDRIHEEKEESAPLPWDDIAGPAHKESLYRRYRRIVDR
jgi:radical SAM superfamily enzyme YgiQ (UPF0313 family)